MSEEAKAAPAAQKAPAKSATVLYRSTSPEVRNIALIGVRGRRVDEEYFEWELTAEQAAKADKHFHVRHGRIAKAK